MAVSDQILRSYFTPRTVIRGMLRRGGREGRALAMLMAACALIFVAQWPRLVREAHLSDDIPLMGLVSAALFGWLFIMPLVFYFVALLVHFAARYLGAQTPMSAARLVTFWSLLAVTPLWLVQGLVAGFWGVGAASGTVLAVLAVLQVTLTVIGMRVAALEPPRTSA